MRLTAKLKSFRSGARGRRVAGRARGAAAGRSKAQLARPSAFRSRRARTSLAPISCTTIWPRSAAGRSICRRASPRLANSGCEKPGGLAMCTPPILSDGRSVGTSSSGPSRRTGRPSAWLASRGDALAPGRGADRDAERDHQHGGDHQQARAANRARSGSTSGSCRTGAAPPRSRFVLGQSISQIFYGQRTIMGRAGLAVLLEQLVVEPARRRLVSCPMRVLLLIFAVSRRLRPGGGVPLPHAGRQDACTATRPARAAARRPTSPPTSASAPTSSARPSASAARSPPRSACSATRKRWRR